MIPLDETAPREEPREKLPRHLSIILDGNGRWAKQRGLSVAQGHREGGRRVESLISHVREIGTIETLSLFAFSKENWRRSHTEVNHLFQLFEEVAVRIAKKAIQTQQVRVRFIGDHAGLKKSTLSHMHHLEKDTADNKGLRVFLALNYSGLWDIAEGARRIAVRAKEKKSLTLLDEAAWQREYLAALPSHEIPPTDLLIRTGGENRLSNFLLYQSIYAEMYSTPTLWPDFDKDALTLALAYYATRERRFGERPKEA